jgi:regulator of sigma E protease
MMSFVQSLAAFILALGLLITFHEFGHFWVARRFDVKILRFSIGFGRPLWMRRFGPDDSEFVIAALPLGGYVKMLDEREGAVTPGERARAFNNRPIMQRFAIVAAGPAFNFIFAILAYWFMYMAGIPGLKPVIAAVEPGSIAEQSGLRAGDRIAGVDGQETVTWTSVIDVTIGKVLEHETAELTVIGADGGERGLHLDLGRVSVDELAGGMLLRKLGVTPLRPAVPAVIGDVVDGGAADRAGLRSGDRVMAVDGARVRDWGHWVEVVRGSAGKRMVVELQRDNESLALELVPEPVLDDSGATFGRIGASVDPEALADRTLLATEHYGIFAALLHAVERTGEMSMITLRVLSKMIVGEASVKNLSGPISIAQYAGESAGIGFMAFVGFLAIVSVSLGVLNLLPIPLLDGGHLMYYLIEIVKGSPVSDASQVVGQQLGLAVLLGLMGLAFYNDIIRLIG